MLNKYSAVSAVLHPDVAATSARSPVRYQPNSYRDKPVLYFHKLLDRINPPSPPVPSPAGLVRQICVLLVHGDAVHFRLNDYSSGKYQVPSLPHGTASLVIQFCNNSLTCKLAIHSKRPTWLESGIIRGGLARVGENTCRSLNNDFEFVSFKALRPLPRCKWPREESQKRTNN